MTKGRIIALALMGLGLILYFYFKEDMESENNSYGRYAAITLLLAGAVVNMGDKIRARKNQSK